MRARLPKPDAEPGTNITVIRQHRAAIEFARALSTIFNPFLNATVLFIIISRAFSTTMTQFWLLSVIGVAFFLAAPLGFVLYAYLTGLVSDFEITDRVERQRVFVAFVLMYLAAAIVLTLYRAPIQLVAITWGYWGTTLATMLITRWWKISTHAFGVAGPFAALFVLFKWQPAPYVVLVPLVCWARMYLRAHTFAQVAVGAALAVLSTLLFFRLFHVL